MTTSQNPLGTKQLYDIYTHRQKLSNTTFFPRHCFWSCRTEYVCNWNHIFWILLQILLLLWALRAKNELVTKYLDNLRPFTKQVKNDKGKHWKKFEADVWKVSFGLTFNRMESYYPEHQLVYYIFLEKIISLARVVNFRYSFNAITPVLLHMIFVDR